MEDIGRRFIGKNRVPTTRWLLGAIYLFLFHGLIWGIFILDLVFLLIVVIRGEPLHDTFFVVFFTFLYMAVAILFLLTGMCLGFFRKIQETELQNRISDSRLMSVIGLESTLSYVLHLFLLVFGTLLPLVYILIEGIFAAKGEPYWTGLTPLSQTFVIILWVFMGIAALAWVPFQIILTYITIALERIGVKLRIHVQTA